MTHSTASVLEPQSTKDRPLLLKTAPSRPPLVVWKRALLLAGAFAACKLLIGVCINLLAPRSGYGLHRDELYYVVCGRHLAWGYVDQPPLVAVQALLADSLFGHQHLWAFRLFASAAGAAMVALTGLLCCALGGRRLAQTLAMIGSLAAIANWPLDTFLSMNSFEPAFWMLALLPLLLMARSASPRWWLLFGAAAGLGVENKHSMVFFLAALLGGLLVTPQRRLLRSRYALGGIALLVLLALPNLMWQAAYGFPTLEWLVRIRRLGKIVELGPAHFAFGQVLLLNPIAFPLWGGGLLWLLFSRFARNFRFAGIAYLLFVPLMYLLHAKDYYLAPIYPVYFAAGGLVWERTLRSRRARRWLVPAYTALLCITSAAYAALLLPVIPREHYARYERLLHFKPPESENFRTAVLPQFLADMTGWNSFVAQVNAGYRALPPGVRARAGIFAGNYGEASAIDVLGPAYGLPSAVSGNQNYWFWGGPGALRDSMLITGESAATVSTIFTHTAEVGRTHMPYAIDFEDNQPIWFATGLREPVAKLWPKLKDWY